MEIGQVLIKVSDFDLVAKHHITAQRFNFADDAFQQGGFAGTIIAHDTDPIALMDLETHFRQWFIIAYLEMIKRQHILASSYTADKSGLEGFGVGLLGIFDLIHPFQIFDLGLGKGSLVFLVAELFDQFFKSLDILLLPFIGRFLSDQIILLLFHKT